MNALEAKKLAIDFQLGKFYDNILHLIEEEAKRGKFELCVFQDLNHYVKEQLEKDGFLIIDQSDYGKGVKFIIFYFRNCFFKKTTR
jgi:hypothetical protein